MTNDALVSIIVLLVGSHYASLIYRLHKAETELAEIRKEFAVAAIAAANAAAQAAVAAASALRK